MKLQVVVIFGFEFQEVCYQKDLDCRNNYYILIEYILYNFNVIQTSVAGGSVRTTQMIILNFHRDLFQNFSKNIPTQT